MGNRRKIPYIPRDGSWAIKQRPYIPRDALWAIEQSLHIYLGMGYVHQNKDLCRFQSQITKQMVIKHFNMQNLM